MITFSAYKSLGDTGLEHKVTIYSRGDMVAELPAGLDYHRLLRELIPALAIGEGYILGSHEFYNVTPEERAIAEAMGYWEIRGIIIREFEEFGGDSAAIIWPGERGGF